MMDWSMLGNSAKVYCLQWIARYAQENAHPLTLLDLGCGAAQMFVELLKTYPHIHFVGVEPSAKACEMARDNLRGLNATIIQGYAYDPIRAKLPHPAYDFVTSFSVLEHVYERPAYLKLVHDCLKPQGYCLMNYDSGHFYSTYWKEHAKTLIGGWLARFGNQGYYQAFVHDAHFKQWAKEANLTILEGKMFNTVLKGIYKGVPAQHRQEYIQRWLELEDWLNTVGIAYQDSDAKTWHTRNFILQPTHSNG